MRALTHLAAALALLGLTACSGSKEEAPTPKAEKKAAGKSGKKGPAMQVRFQPGRWDTTVKVDKLELGNAPEAVRRAVQSAMGKEHSFAYCLTPEEAAKPDSNFFNQGKKSDCTYDEYEVKGGRLDAKMTCKGPDGDQTVSLNGTYAADTYSMTMSTSGNMGQGIPMLMTMNLSSRRTGECTGNEGK